VAAVERDLSVPPERVFGVLADGWLYGLWVVGASHIRDVDDEWPAVGSRIHHAFGVWPALVRDQTRVVESDPPRRLVLQARAWPAGSARIEVTAEPLPDGGSRLCMNEYPISGLGARLDNPLSEKLLYRRNIESVARLAALVERRPQPARPGTAPRA
jgi:uncharacterized protein YndB with AHSA1/START domain